MLPKEKYVNKSFPQIICNEIILVYYLKTKNITWNRTKWGEKENNTVKIN